MRRTWLTLALSVLVTSAALAEPQIAATPVEDDSYPTPPVSFPGGVRGRPGLAYSEPAGYRPLRLDLYLPPETAKRPPSGYPLVVYIHGGGWTGGDRRRSGAFVDFPGVLAQLAARGYVVASIDHRLSAEAAFPAQAQDVKAAIRWLRERGAVYGIDPARAMTWGVSSGGHLAALAALSCDAAAASECVQGAVAWSGTYDLGAAAAQARALLGCAGASCKKGAIAAASPVSFIDAKDPPLLLIAGDADSTVPAQQATDFAARLKAAGVAGEVIVLPGVDHELLGRGESETRAAHLRALDETFKFFDKTLGVHGR